MHQQDDEQYLNYLSQLHGTLKVLSANALEQCEIMDAYNAPWEVRRDGGDFIEAVLTLGAGKLDENVAVELLGLRDALVTLPEAAVTPLGQDMTTIEGCLVAFTHEAWGTVRTDAASCLRLIENLFA